MVIVIIFTVYLELWSTYWPFQLRISLTIAELTLNVCLLLYMTANKGFWGGFIDILVHWCESPVQYTKLGLPAPSILLSQFCLSLKLYFWVLRRSKKLLGDAGSIIIFLRKAILRPHLSMESVDIKSGNDFPVWPKFTNLRFSISVQVFKSL